jgi:DNA-directed RNA polymerase specialized sigma24 family protein
MGSPLTPVESRAVQAFHYFGGCSITELAQRFHRNRRTIRKALAY